MEKRAQTPRPHVGHICPPFFLAGAPRVFLLCLGASSTAAHAQALDRYFPANVLAYQDWATAATSAAGAADLAAQGVRLGSIVLHPVLTTAIGYDTSPFGSGDTGGGGTGLVQTSARLAADTDWSRDAMHASLDVTDNRYLSFPRRSFTDWNAALGATVDHGQDKLEFGYIHENDELLATGLGAFGQTQPIAAQIDDVRLSDTIDTGRISVVPAVVAQAYRFGNASGETTTGGAFNRNAVTTSLTAGYTFGGGHNLLATISDSTVGYQGSREAGRPASYNDVSGLVGLEYRQSALIIYRALVGYEVRDAIGRGADAGGISSPAAELDVIWRPSVLTALTFNLAQSLQNQPTAVTQGLRQTSTGLMIDHDYSRTVTLHASLLFLRVQFPQNGLTQLAGAASISGTWRLGRNLSLQGGYDFNENGAGGPATNRFVRHQILLHLNFAL